MSSLATAIVGSVVGAAAAAPLASAVIGSSLAGAAASSHAAGKAADAQAGAADAGLSEQRRQFDEMQALMAPYAESGENSLIARDRLSGVAGADAQQEEIDQLEASPQFQSMVSQGEEGILQNASATGGLRGGNVQGALAQFRPQMLNQLIESQYGRLNQQVNQGQAAAAGQVAAGQNNANSISELLAQKGQAQAGGALAQGQAIANVGNAAGQFATLKGMKVF